MAAKKFTQKEAEEMHQLLIQIHGGLKDKIRNKEIMKMPSYELFWMLAIENHLPKQKQIINKYLNKSRRNHKVHK